MRPASQLTLRSARTVAAAGLLVSLAGGWILLLLCLSTAPANALPADVSPVPDPAQGCVTSTLTISFPATLPSSEPGVLPRQAAPQPLIPEGIVALQSIDDRMGSPGAIRVASIGPDEISLGDRVEYLLVISNTGAQNAVVTAQDVLPIAVDEQLVECYPACLTTSEVVSLTITTPSRYGAPEYTMVVTWALATKWQGIGVPAGEYRELEISIPVSGRDDGDILRNRAYVQYTLSDGSGGSSLSNWTDTVVRVDIEPGSGTTLSRLPIWQSQDRGGARSIDWGDFDRDGYLDLAVGGSQGVWVYRNEQGRLVRFWNSDQYTHDLHWIDLDADGALELLAIGYNWWTERVDNRIYRRTADGMRFDEVAPTSLTGARLLQAAPLDIDRDGDQDLIALTYELWTADGCAYRLYRNDGDFFNGPYHCLFAPQREYATTAEDFLSLGDYDNDDDLDLLVDVWDYGNPDDPPACGYRDLMWLLPNSGGRYTGTAPILIDTITHCGWPVHATWGDYDRDGDFDLAAALPTLTGTPNHQVRIYRNQWIEQGGAGPAFAAPVVLPLPNHLPPYAAEWSDYDNDGDLDLAVAGLPFRIYVNEGGSFSPTRFFGPPAGSRGFALDLAVADYDNDDDVDLAVGNPFEPSALYAIFTPRLDTRMSVIARRGASSVAWADANGEGSLDLVFGAPDTLVNADLYYNDFGRFPGRLPYNSSGFGPHGLAFGDMNGDLVLDLALATPSGAQVNLAGNLTEPDWSDSSHSARAAAWGDADDDGDLDLAVGTDGTDLLFFNNGKTLAKTPGVSFLHSDPTRSVAWADVNADNYLDLALGNYGQPTRVYLNNRDGTFRLAWTTAASANTTSVAWADFDGDGDPDLALGNYGQPNVIYENQGGILGTHPVWTAGAARFTNSIAWGDWDRDGDLDLAVGNWDQADQVYLNRDSRPGAPRLAWIWSSSETLPTTGVAWGDRDGDGDLDLAVSSESCIGYYENHTILPAHLASDFLPLAPLPENPPYVSVARPGETRDGFFYSSAELLSGPEHPTVTVRYRLFDPDGTRQKATSNAPGDPLAKTLFEYSLDGGTMWHPATPVAGAPPPMTTTLRLGQEATFIWDAVADGAISDNARFRIGIIPNAPTGSLQHGISWAVSPPFRIRGTTCIWPTVPGMTISNLRPALGERVWFEGWVDHASGVLSFLWDFGDGSTDQGQRVSHQFFHNNAYTVRLTIRSEPCPIAKELILTRMVFAGTGAADIHLPVVMKGPP